VDRAIPHPAAQRKHGYVLMGYLVFCAARGVMQVVAAWALLRASAPGPVPAYPLALLGVLNLLGAAGVWRWSWTGAAMLCVAAVGAIVVASSRGLSLSVLVAGLMLAASLIVAAGVTWQLRCLRCRAVVSRLDAKCAACGQPFA
jgi:hypothetical protein